jgi:hypothetical protein
MSIPAEYSSYIRLILDYAAQIVFVPWYVLIHKLFSEDEAGIAFVIVGLVLVMISLWFWWDACEYFDYFGAGALVIAFIIVGPTVLLGYIAAKALANLTTLIRCRPRKEDEWWYWRYRHHLRQHRIETKPLTRKELDAIGNIRIDTTISEEEKDRNIEEYLMSGRRDEAIKYTKEMLTVAKSMRDNKAAQRYEKYLLAIMSGKLQAREPGSGWHSAL